MKNSEENQDDSKIDESENKEVFQGEVRDYPIESRKGKSTFGFICNHNYRKDGYNKDIFFSSKSIETAEKICRNDFVSFKVMADGTNDKIWAVCVRLLKGCNNGQEKKDIDA